MISSRSLIVLVATVAGVATTTALGRWQLNRADEKATLRDTMLTRGHLPPLGNFQLPCTESALQPLLQRAVQLRGRWLPDRTVWLDNRPMGGQAGMIVLAPLQLEPAADVGVCAARVILVQRGWAPRNFADRERLAPVPTPAGLVEVSGRLVSAPSRLLELGQGVAQPVGRLRQNVDPALLAAEWGVRLYPGSVQQTSDERPAPEGGTGLKRDWWQPGAEIGRHQAYAAQWFALAALMAGLYGWFQWWRPRRGQANDDEG